jgi:hypothetical protein
LAVGCSDYEVVQDSKYQDYAGNSGEPDIAVDPTAIDFGSSAVDDAVEISEAITVTNEGDEDLHISGVSLLDDDTAFTVGAISSVLIQPGNAAQLTVTFTPESANTSTDVLLIESDDPDESTVEVALEGEGIAPMIDVDPGEYDFGTLYIGCEGLLPVTISNVGNDDLIITDLEYNTGSDDLVFDSYTDVNGDLPWTLSEGEGVEVFVSYLPVDEYEDTAYLMVDSNDPSTPTVMAEQVGMGDEYGNNADVFEQPLQGSTDIIFAVDRSGSMYDEIESVQDNFDTFMTTMSGMDADFHIAATVEDNGCINGSDLWIDSEFSASEATDTITTMINLYGSYGSYTEMAFSLLEACLAESESGGCNEGLVRDDAKLNLVGVSDEPEQSVNPYSYYVSLFQSLKDDSDDVVFHAIGGDYPSGCGGASAYTGFYESTVATGGLFLSICATDWGAHLEDLAEGSAADLSSFSLTDTPVPDTIVVKVDGVTTTLGWEFNEDDNTVEFEDDYIPDGGSTIEVEYSLYGDCDL